MFKRIINYYSEGLPPRGDFPRGVSGLLKYIKHLFSEMPLGISHLIKLQPISALITASVLIFLLRRGFGHIPFVIVFVLFTIIYLTIKFYLIKNTHGIITKVTDIAVMFFINDMLLFILPFYFESMTFPSRNILFGLIITTLAIFANWYYAFQKIVLRSLFFSSVYYAMIVFCVLNFIFPIIFGMRNIWSIAISAGISALTAILFVYPHFRLNSKRQDFIKFIFSVVLTAGIIWTGRSFIPPVPLRLMDAAACLDVLDYTPLVPFETQNLEDIKEVSFYSAILAPAGLSEKINHVWYHNGNKLFSVDVSEIIGGRKEGFRTWSKHTILEGPGKYVIEVWTAGGQLLGEGSFTLR